MSNPSTASEVDAGVWHAIAGASVKIPSPHSYAYYFPEGHIEHSPSPAIANSSIPLKRPLIFCQVLSVRLLSSHISDQVFAKILLQPLQPHVQRVANHDGNGDDDLRNGVVSFAKILTPSDANNGGGFSVPRYCAESIFPPLDFEADPPVQNLTMKDTATNAWEFRHIYRGTPRRHLLTTGWSKFVNAKRLVAGDSTVFMRKESTAELVIGVRRAARFGAKNAWTSAENAANGNKDEAMEAMVNAAKGMAFEVVYYPRAGFPDFVVSAERVEDALRICWSPGMQVKMAVETEDLSRMAWYQGTIIAAASPGAGPWRGSPWRMLQVTWDEVPLQNMNRLNPWQIEYVLPLPRLHSPFPLHKKFKVLQHHGKLADEEANCHLLMNEITDLTAENLSSSMFNHSSFPASMQGARRNQFTVSSLSNSESDNSLQTLTNLLTNGEESKLNPVSTALNIKNSPLDNLSSSSQNSDQFCGIGSSGQQRHSSSSPSDGRSFQLFGKIIQIPKSVEPGLSNEDRCTDGEYQEHSITNNQPNSSPDQNRNGVFIGVIVNTKEPQL